MRKHSARMSQWRSLICLGWAILLMSACSPGLELTFDATRDVASVPTELDVPTGNEGANQSLAPGKTLTLKEAMNIRTLKNNVLDFVVELPAGTQLRIFDETSAQNYDYRNTDGSVERSSTGFLSPIEVVSVPESAQKILTEAKLNSINSATGGVYISASISGELFRNQEMFAAITGAAAGAGFLKYYLPSGKPTFSYSTGIRKRFGTNVNKAVPMSALSAAEQTKWTKIYAELKKAGDRSVPAPRELMIIGSSDAKALSIRFEKEGFVNDIGGWSVAVEGTATRHGFADVPCAETMSELIRQAYKRAGYNHTEDFNATKGNKLYWTSTAAVVELSRSLNVAGWIPWDATAYRPMTGSIVMHTTGISPGHTYMAGGHDGRIIVDNGSPKGRDLRATSNSIIGMMYMSGVFFLPPGIQPQAW